MVSRPCGRTANIRGMCLGNIHSCCTASELLCSLGRCRGLLVCGLLVGWRVGFFSFLLFSFALFPWGVGTVCSHYRKPIAPCFESDKHSPSHQHFNDAIKAAVAYKENSGDFMDEVMQELEARKALLTALLLRDWHLCPFFPLRESRASGKG